MAGSLAVGEKIIFAGQRKDINELLQASDCFVLPTLTEALPTVLIEAMAAKIPIIASKVGGVPEMVINEKNGLLLEPGDYVGLAQACIRLAKDRALRDAMAREGNTIVHDKFNITNMIRAITETYFEVLENGKRI
jgi:glycosyltransferase involved in cell wall biosynthesis